MQSKMDWQNSIMKILSFLIANLDNNCKLMLSNCKDFNSTFIVISLHFITLYITQISSSRFQCISFWELKVILQIEGDNKTHTRLKGMRKHIT